MATRKKPTKKESELQAQAAAEMVAEAGVREMVDGAEALDVIRRLAPDPLNLGDRRILISEYGVFEMELGSEAAWRAQTVLQTAATAGLLGAIAWQIYDNECKDSAGNYFPVDSSPGSALRPIASQCRGLWLVKPDGSQSNLVAVLSPYWQK